MSSFLFDSQRQQLQSEFSKPILEPNPSSLIPQNVALLLKSNRNKKLEEMCYKLINFKLEINNAILQNKNLPFSIPHHKFRYSIYNELEIMLTQCSYFISSSAINEKINETYKWFKDKMKLYFTLSSIQHKSYADKNEKHIIPNEEETKQEQDDEEERQLHRTKFTHGFNIKLYKVKKIKASDNSNSNRGNQSNSSRKNDQDVNFKKGVFNYSLQNTNNFYVKKRERCTCVKSMDDKVVDKKQDKEEVFDPDKDLKGSYCYAKPKFTVSRASLEQRMIREKQKEIQEKRSLEQIKMAVDSFGEKRGMFKGNQLKSYEIKKVAKYYQDKLDIEHEEALKLYCKPQENEEEENEEKENNEHDKHKEIINQHQEKEIIKEKPKPKIDVSNVKNISPTTKLLSPSSNETTVTIRMKLTRDKALHELVNKKYETNNYDELPPDAFYVKASTNPIFSARLRLMNFEYENAENTHSSKNRLSSLYINIYNTNSKKELRKSQSTKEYIINSIENGNYNLLDLRRSFSITKLDETQNVNKYHLDKGKHVDRTALRNAFINPEDSFAYPRYYLPSTQGDGLLTKPNEKENKDGKKKKKKVNTSQESV
jgi:hypothetical protein